MNEFYVSKTSNLAEFITKLAQSGLKSFWLEDMGDKWFISHAQGDISKVKDSIIVLDHPEFEETKMSEVKTNLTQDQINALKALSEAVAQVTTVEQKINKELATKEVDALKVIVENQKALVESQNVRIKKIEELLSGDMSKLEKIKAALNAMNAALGKLD